MRTIISVYLLSILLAGGTHSQTAPVVEAGNLSFFDSLERVTASRWFVSNGWVAGPVWSCTLTNKNLSINNGAMNLTLRTLQGTDGPATCAEVQSQKFYGYGTFEVRMQAAAGAGTSTAFFTYTGSPHGPIHNEIDFEFLGKDPTIVQLNYHVAGNGKHEKIVNLGFDASKSMNDYAFAWMPDSITWYVNGRQVHQVKTAESGELPSHPGKIMFYLLRGTKQIEPWLGAFNYAGETLVASFEHVAFTEMGKPCQFPSSIVCARN